MRGTTGASSAWSCGSSGTDCRRGSRMESGTGRSSPERERDAEPRGVTHSLRSRSDVTSLYDDLRNEAAMGTKTVNPSEKMQLSIVTPPVMGPAYFREASEVRHGMTIAAPPPRR